MGICNGWPLCTIRKMFQRIALRRQHGRDDGNAIADFRQREQRMRRAALHTHPRLDAGQPARGVEDGAHDEARDRAAAGDASARRSISTARPAGEPQALVAAGDELQRRQGEAAEQVLYGRAAPSTS